MAEDKFLAREFDFYASVDGSTNWTKVAGVNEWGWVEDSEEEDVQDFDDSGWEAPMVIGRKSGITIAGFEMIDVTDGSRDPGQKILYSAARKMGPEGYTYVRVVPKAVALASSKIEGRVTVKSAERGGAKETLKMGFDLMFKGEPTLAGIFDPDA